MGANDFKGPFPVDLLFQSPQGFFDRLAFFKLNLGQTSSLPLQKTRVGGLHGRLPSLVSRKMVFFLIALSIGKARRADRPGARQNDGNAPHRAPKAGARSISGKPRGIWPGSARLLLPAMVGRAGSCSSRGFPGNPGQTASRSWVGLCLVDIGPPARTGKNRGSKPRQSG